MPEATVTIPVEELAKLVKHGDSQLFFYNLPRIGHQQFHRCIEIRFWERGGEDGSELEFTITHNSSRVATVTHKLNDLFMLLPRLTDFLARQEKART